MIQRLSDDFREWRMCRNQDEIKRRIARRDFWRREIGKPWLDLVPSWAPWAAIAVFWGAIAWLALR